MNIEAVERRADIAARKLDHAIRASETAQSIRARDKHARRMRRWAALLADLQATLAQPTPRRSSRMTTSRFSQAVLQHQALAECALLSE